MIPELKEAFRYPIDAQRSILIVTVRTLARERDELRAEVERLTADRNCEKRMRQDAEESRENALAEVERLKADKARRDCRLFNSGYLLGHHDTVEGQYTDIHRDDFETYHSEEVAEIAAWPDELL